MVLTSEKDINSKKLLTSAPEFLLTSVDVGKKLSLVQLMMKAQETVTRSRARLMYRAVELMMQSEMCEMLGVPDNINDIARAMGHVDSVSQELTNATEDQGSETMRFFKTRLLLCMYIVLSLMPFFF